MKNKIYFTLFIILIASLNAQSTNSLYSMFGVGQIIDDSYGINRALGGTGIAFHSGTTLNFKNPAAYLGTNPNSFALEVGMYGLNQNSNNGSINSNMVDMNLSYISLSSYFKWWWAFNLGVVPFSNIDYDVNTTNQVESDLSYYEKNFLGTGGLNRMYIGNSFVVNKNLNVGFNLSYIFGNISQTETASATSGISDYILTDETTANGIYMDYGLQYSLYDNDNWLYTLGLTYGRNKVLDTSHDLELYDDKEIIELDDDNEGSVIEIPQKVGIGFAVTKLNQFRLGLDYEFKQWSDISFNNPNLITRNSNRYSFGMEYGHVDIKESNLFRNLVYRVGGFYKSSYLEIDNIPINSMGVNIGLGIPLNKINLVNISLEYGQEGTLENNLVKNTYYGMYVNFSLFEFLAR